MLQIYHLVPKLIERRLNYDKGAERKISGKLIKIKILFGGAPLPRLEQKASPKPYRFSLV